MLQRSTPAYCLPTLSLIRECRLQKDKQAAELASAESRGKAAAELDQLRQEAAAAEQRVQTAKVCQCGLFLR